MKTLNWLLQVSNNLNLGMISAIHHVHRKGYIHLDLKSMNIGIDRNGVLKIFDFGLSHKMT
jgi:serine/threonine protein kinase